jgi:hypothetical protein
VFYFLNSILYRIYLSKDVGQIDEKAAHKQNFLELKITKKIFEPPALLVLSAAATTVTPTTAETANRLHS